MQLEHQKNIRPDRLKRRSDFLRVQRSEKKWITKHFIVQVAERADEKVCYGLVVSKKFSKKAVDRNRAKRRLRALIDEKLLIDCVCAGDYVFISRATLNDADFQTLQKDLDWALRKMDLLK